ncbi:hypothetical protein KAH37_06990 [bacterium]|nr:hypothetical protein [bacterium]
MKIRFFTLVSIILLSLFLFVSCGDSGEKCDDGYTWNSSTGECEKDAGDVDKDNYQPPVDKDTSGSDGETTDGDSEIDGDEATDGDTPYTGDCISADDKGVINIDIKQRTLTIGAVTSDITIGSTAIGELWAEHTYTRSMYKLADVDDALSGKKFEIPVASYNIYYRHILATGKTADTGVQVGDTVKIESDKSIDIAIPLVHITGAVTKNGAAFPALTGTNATDTVLVLSNETLTFTISYADFAAYGLDIPTGSYALYFIGYFSDAAPLFEGVVLPQATGFEVTESGEVAIDIPTITTSGSATIDGAPVTAGLIVLIDNPPFGSIAGTLISDIAASTSYSLEMLGGAHTNYSVVYLPTLDSYPSNWVKVDKWAGFSATASKNISLDFGRLFGVISYKGGEFPPLTECEATELSCTRGKLKLLSFDGTSSITMNNLGATGSDYAYEALVVRRIASVDPVDPEKTIYTPRKYSLAFEGFFNDIKGIYEKIPFLSEAKYLNSDSILTSMVDFQKADESYLTQREIDINIAPRTVSGTVSFNGNAISCDKDEYIYAVNNVTKDEVPIINLNDLTDTSFSVEMPEGTYTLVYDGECLLTKRHKVPVFRDLSVSDTVSGVDVAMKTSRFLLQHTIDGTPYKEWLKAHTEVKEIIFTVGAEKAALRWELIEKMDGDTPTVAVFNGEDWSLSMSVITGEGEEASESVFPLYTVKNMKADVTIEADIPAIPFTTQLTIDGKVMVDATEWRGKLEFGAESFYLIKYPKKGATAAKGFALPGEYTGPTPTIFLNSGFDAAEKLRLDCIFID